MLTKQSAYKYETPHKGPFVKIKCFTNGTVTLQYSTTQITYNIRRIKPYISDTEVEDSNSINMSDGVNT